MVCLAKKGMPSGGKRDNAGRKNKYGEETVVLPVRVPKSKKDELKQIIEKQLKKWEVKKP